MKNGFTLTKGATHVNTSNNSRQAAFTLAEVLITLGIIGVVAALTMPNLIANHQKKVVVSRLEKFYTTINQAIKLSEADNGTCENWNYPDSNGVDSASEFYRAYLKKYLSVLSEKEEVVNIYKLNKTIDYTKSYYIVYFSDGSAMGLNWDDGMDIHFWPQSSNINRNLLSSRSDFTFNFKKGASSNYCSVEPYTFRWDGTRDDLKENPRYGCSLENINSVGAFCAKLIQYDGWEISDDYPWR